MAFLLIDGERYALSEGETTLGGPSDEILRTSPLAALPPFAILSSFGDGMTVRALRPGAVSLNGGMLGAAETPVRHGDHLTVESVIVHIGDIGAAGRTARAPGVSDAQAGASGALPGATPTAATGGVLTAEATGEAYAIPGAGLVIGRDPDCHVVITSRDVSRRHATIEPGLLGYTLRDHSTNGVFVNGERAERTQRLGQDDVVRIGDVTFRFHADAASFEPGDGVWQAAPVALVAPEPPPAPHAPQTSAPTTAPMARRSRDGAPACLATLKVLEGRVPTGMLFRIERPVAQIGRGAACDVCLVDDSVSGAHATLILRGDRWHLIDHSSRNGTYVDGRRVEQCELSGACELRLGGVTLHFQPVAVAAPSPIGTLGLIGLTDEQVDRRARR